MKYKFKLLEVERLRDHEDVYPEQVKSLATQIKKDGVAKVPIIVDNRYYIILDGHHRFEALKFLGCKRVPAYLVDYFDDSIGLELWPEAMERGITKLTKEQVILKGLTDEKFPPKTSRHIFKNKPKDIEVKLEELL